MCAGAKSADKIKWSEEQIEAFNAAKAHLQDAKVITLPRRDDQLQIISDASRTGLASALYVIRDKPLLAGIFNVQLKGTQKMWLPCELEALSIGAGVKHFGPYLVQSKHATQVLTDSKPCVEAYRKLQQGQFSASSRVTSFLSIISRYGVKLSHIAGQKNVLSDYLSRNTLVCDGGCQICTFVERSDAAVVREVQVSDVLSGSCMVPFSTRSTWYQCQQDCAVLKEVAKYLADGRTPSRKKKGIKEIRRYLNTVKLSTSPNDGLLVVPQQTPLGRSRQRIVVPREVLDGLLTALHLQLMHPSKYQLKQVFARGFFALDADKAIDRIVDSCHACAALKKVPTRFKMQSTSVPADEGIGIRFGADVVKREKQLILLIREYVSSFTDACFIPSESAKDLKDGVIKLMSRLRTHTGPPVILRLDPAPGFEAKEMSKGLSQLNISVEIGAPKNVNKNPVAEKSVSEFHAEVARLAPTGGPLDDVILALAISNLNSRIRQGGLSSSEVWRQRDMYTGDQLPMNDLDVIRNKAECRQKAHLPSAKHSARGLVTEKPARTHPGDIVYIYQDRDKTRSRDRYIVIRVEGRQSVLRKFSGNQLRAKEYLVDNVDIITVKPHIFPVSLLDDDDTDSCDDVNYMREVPKGDNEEVEEDEVDEDEATSEEGEDQSDTSTDNSEDESEDEPAVQQSPQNAAEPRRSGRSRRPPEKLESYLTGRRLNDAVPEAE